MSQPDPTPRPPGPDLFFRVVWRWHFYAGVLVGLPLIVLAVTGGLYVFKDELYRAVNADVAFVTPGPTRVSYAAQIAAAREASPAGYQATGLEIPDDPDQSTTVALAAPKQPARRVGIDPYTGRVLGEFAYTGFFPAVRQLHRNLMLSDATRVAVDVIPGWKFTLDPPRLVVELATSWTVVLLGTGLYLWWPRRKDKIHGVVVPRLGAKRYTALRDLHTLAGVSFLPVVLVVALTGLMYSTVWGTSFRAASRATGANTFFSDFPKSAGKLRFPVDDAVAEAQKRFPGHPLHLNLPRGTNSSYVFLVRGHSGPHTQGLLVLHRADGSVLMHKPLDEFPAVMQWAMWDYTLHVGDIGGTATKVLWAVACVVLVWMPVTGVWMWWQRRPRGRVGLPRRPAAARVPGWVVAAAVLLGLFLPTVGASVVVILLLEWLVGRVGRIRRRPMSLTPPVAEEALP